MREFGEYLYVYTYLKVSLEFFFTTPQVTVQTEVTKQRKPRVLKCG